MTSKALTTRTLPTEIDGLAAGIAALEEQQPSGLVLEATSPQPLREVAAAVQASGRPVIAVIGGLFADDADADPFAPIDADDPARAIVGLRTTTAACARLACSRLVVPVSTSAGSTSSREELADRLCRRTHALASEWSGLQLLLLATDEPGAAFDPELGSWVMEDLAQADVGVALDQHTTDGHEPWFASIGDRLGLVLLGHGIEAGALANACGDRIPWAIRGPAT